MGADKVQALGTQFSVERTTEHAEVLVAEINTAPQPVSPPGPGDIQALTETSL